MKKQPVRRMFCVLLILAMLAGTVPALGAEGQSPRFVDLYSDATTYALDDAGNLWGWGSNAYGQLGLGYTSSEEDPVIVFDRVEDFFVSSYSGVFALRTDGSLWTVGGLVWDQEGPPAGESDKYQLEPIRLSSGGIKKVFYPYFIKSDDSLWQWEENKYNVGGAILTRGCSSTASSKVMDGVAGLDTYLLLKTDGSLWLRDGMTKVMDGVAGFSSGHRTLDASGGSTGAEGPCYMALKTDGTLWTWGSNSGAGRLGNGTTQSSAQPRQILSGVRMARYGGLFGIAVKTDGTVWGWGSNSNYQLNFTLDGSLTALELANQCYLSPRQVLDGVEKVSGSSRVYALTEEGTILYWGAQYTTGGVMPLKPTSMQFQASVQTGPTLSYGGADSFTRVELVSAGVLALRRDGSLWAWGDNTNGRLLAEGEDILTPTRIMDGVKDMALGSNFALVVKTDGTVWGWGNNRSGQLGDGTTVNRTQPVQVSGLTGIARVTAGRSCGFAVGADGGLWAWGTVPDVSSLGDGATTKSLTPIRVMEGVAQMAAGGNDMLLALKTDGTVWGWGRVRDELSFNGGSGGTEGVGDPTPRAVFSGAEFITASLDSFPEFDWAAVTSDHRAVFFGNSMEVFNEISTEHTLNGTGGTAVLDLFEPQLTISGVKGVSVGCGGLAVIKTDGSLWARKFFGKDHLGNWSEGEDIYGFGPWWEDGVEDDLRCLMDGSSQAAYVISAFPEDLAVLLADGSLWMLGRNDHGEVGTGTAQKVARLTRIQVPQSEDAPSAWAQEEVAEAISAGLVPEGLQQNYTGAVTRGEAAELFLRLLEVSTGLSTEELLSEHGAEADPAAFADIDDPAVLAAHALGLINGVGEGKFDPDGTFTRAQIAAILNRAARVLGVETEGYGHSFTDVSGHWAEPELGWPVHAGILSGVGEGRFDPDGVLTTEQAILMTWRALEALG